MDNPYQAPTAPIAAPTVDGPVDRSVTIDSPKGPVRLEKRGEVVTIVLGDIRKDLPAAKFVSSVILHFTRTRRISFRPISLYSIAITEQKFREVLDFYGVERFKQHDILSMRTMHALFGLLFIFLAVLNADDLSTSFELGILCFGVMNLALFALTFSRRYFVFWSLSFVTYLVLGATMGIQAYDGDWWALAIIIFVFFSLSTSLSRIRYFSGIADAGDGG